MKRRNCAQYLWVWRQSVVPNDAPRDFGPQVAFGAKFQIPVARQAGREMSAPRPFETLGSICNRWELRYIYRRIYHLFHVGRTSVYIDNCACALAEILNLRFRTIFKVRTFFFLGYMLVGFETTFPQSLNALKQI